MADPLRSYLGSLPEYSSARAQFLYSSLPARKASNPTGYQGAISWWRLTLSALVSKGLLGEDKLILVAEEDLKEKLRWDKIGKPSSLGTILVRLSFASPFAAVSSFALTCFHTDRAGTVQGVHPVGRLHCFGRSCRSLVVALAPCKTASVGRLARVRLNRSGGGCR